MFFEATSVGSGDPQDCSIGADEKADRTVLRSRWLEREVLPYEQFVRRHLTRRFPFVRNMIDDIIHSTYLRLMATPSVDHVKDGKNYFYQAATSVVRDQLRRDQIREGNAVDYAKVDEASLGCEAPIAEEELDSRRAMKRFFEVLHGMPQRQQAVIEMRRIEGLCVRETACRLGVSVSTVEKLQLKALQQLGEAMANTAFGASWRKQARTPIVENR